MTAWGLMLRRRARDGSCGRLKRRCGGSSTGSGTGGIDRAPADHRGEDYANARPGTALRGAARSRAPSPLVLGRRRQPRPVEHLLGRREDERVRALWPVCALCGSRAASASADTRGTQRRPEATVIGFAGRAGASVHCPEPTWDMSQPEDEVRHVTATTSGQLARNCVSATTRAPRALVKQCEVWEDRSEFVTARRSADAVVWTRGLVRAMCDNSQGPRRWRAPEGKRSAQAHRLGGRSARPAAAAEAPAATNRRAGTAHTIHPDRPRVSGIRPISARLSPRREHEGRVQRGDRDRELVSGGR